MNQKNIIISMVFFFFVESRIYSYSVTFTIAIKYVNVNNFLSIWFTFLFFNFYIAIYFYGINNNYLTVKNIESLEKFEEICTERMYCHYTVVLNLKLFYLFNYWFNNNNLNTKTFYFIILCCNYWLIFEKIKKL